MGSSLINPILKGSMETILYITAISLGTLWALKHEREQNLNSDRTQSMTRKGR